MAAMGGTGGWTVAKLASPAVAAGGLPDKDSVMVLESSIIRVFASSRLVAAA
jgi:hypothetical protein